MTFVPLLGFHTIPGDDTVVDVGDFNTMVDDDGARCGGGGRGGNDDWWGGGSLITTFKVYTILLRAGRWHRI